MITLSSLLLKEIIIDIWVITRDSLIEIGISGDSIIIGEALVLIVFRDKQDLWEIMLEVEAEEEVEEIKRNYELNYLLWK